MSILNLWSVQSDVVNNSSKRKLKKRLNYKKSNKKLKWDNNGNKD